MHQFWGWAAAVVLCCGAVVLSPSSESNAADREAAKKAPRASNFKMKSLTGKEVDLAWYYGKAIMRSSTSRASAA